MSAIDPQRDPWLAFYLGHGLDHRGRTLEQIWGFSYRAFEATHDYIQWLFPIRTPSGFNPHAPLMDDARAAFARGSVEMRRRLTTSLARMLGFYGFDLTYTERVPEIVVADDERNERWLSHGNHNYLRISRILGCLVEVGMEAEARAFFGALAELYALEDEGAENRIGPRAFAFWGAAARAV